MLFYTAGTGDVRPVLCSTVFITVEQIKKLNLESRAVVPDGKFSSWIRGADGVQPPKTHSESTAFTNCFTKKPHRSFVKQDPDPH